LQLHSSKEKLLQDYLVGKLMLFLMHRFKAHPKSESEELLKIRKAVDLHEYAEFKELVKLGTDNLI
jgi:hypothetical protein